jgi:membrane protease YdiL (CAAX protease family)
MIEPVVNRSGWLSFEMIGVYGFTAFVIAMCLADGNSAAFGLRRSPAQGWKSWIRLALLFAAIILALGALCAAAWWIMGWPLPLIRRPPSAFAPTFYWYCIVSPVVEEVIFRILFTLALLPVLGPRGCILVNGVLFGWVHYLRGIPGPDNLIAGFMLEWAYLRSGTVLVPLAMHSAGNFIAMSSHIANWYLLGGA